MLFKSKLQKMFDRQKNLAKNFIPIDDLHDGKLNEREKYLLTYSGLLIEETVEAQREIPQRKFWRPSVKNKKMDTEAWKEEMMDILHIVIAMCLIGGMNADEVYDRYCKKNDINLERVKNNS